jgi:hypothetical protein
MPDKPILCEYRRCGTTGQKEGKRRWRARLVLRIWNVKSPKIWKDWKVCEHCCDLMISSRRPDQHSEKKHFPETVQKVTQKAKPKPKKKTTTSQRTSRAQREARAALARDQKRNEKKRRDKKRNKKQGGRATEKKPALRKQSVEGRRVTHINPDTGKMGIFGPGAVIAISGQNVTVDFDAVGEKKVKEQYLEGLPR